MNHIAGPEMRYAVFIHWSKDDKISEADLAYINSLSELFDKVLIVRNRNNSEVLVPQNLAFDEKVETLNRNNDGYDFGGYQAGILYLLGKEDKISEILICNNSVYQVNQKLVEFIGIARSSELEVIAATSSIEIKYHLQSYFLLFKAPVVNSNEFHKYWNELPTYQVKQDVVDNLEVNLASYFYEFQYKIGAVIEIEKLLKFISSNTGQLIADATGEYQGTKHLINCLRADMQFNPTHHAWNYLLEMGFPFLKKDLVRNHKDMGLDLSNWQEFASTFAPNYVKSSMAQDQR